MKLGSILKGIGVVSIGFALIDTGFEFGKGHIVGLVNACLDSSTPDEELYEEFREIPEYEKASKRMRYAAKVSREICAKRLQKEAKNGAVKKVATQQKRVARGGGSLRYVV